MLDVLTKFASLYPAEGQPFEPGSELSLVKDELLDEFWIRFNGSRFGGGVFQLFTPASAVQWKETLQSIWPEFSMGFCFGANWLGQIVVAQSKKLGGPISEIYLFDPIGGEILAACKTIQGFFELALMSSDEVNGILLPELFKDWIQRGNPPPQLGECVGYIKPLFLGGSDIDENMEVIDMDVYWTVTGGIISKINSV